MVRCSCPALWLLWARATEGDTGTSHVAQCPLPPSRAGGRPPGVSASANGATVISEQNCSWGGTACRLREKTLPSCGKACHGHCCSLGVVLVKGRGARLLVIGVRSPCWQPSCSRARRSRPALLRALTTFSSSLRRTLFIFGLPLSPEGLRQSPSAVTDCTSILTCQVAGKFSTMQGPSGRGERATSLPPLVPLRRLFRAREGGGWESGRGRACPGAKGWLGVLFSLTLAAWTELLKGVLTQPGQFGQ